MSVNAIRRAAAAAVLVFGLVLWATVASGAAQNPHRRLSAPQGLRVVRTSGASVVVAWKPVRGSVSFGLYRNGVRVGKTNEPRATFDGLDCGRRYSFAVDASDRDGGRSDRSAIATSTASCPRPRDTQPPSKPGGLATTSVTQTTAALSWNASTDDVGVVSYNVYRDGDKVADATTTSAKIDGLACGRNYAFSVEAVDAAGNHSGRATLTVSTSACPPPPTPRPGPDRQPPSKPSGLSATSVTRTSVSLSWTAATDNVGVALYVVFRDGDSVAQPTGTSATVAGLSCGRMYAFSVEAADAAGNHSGRTTIATSTASCAPPPDTQAPSVVPGIAATGSTDTSVTLSWTAATDNVGVVSYELYRDDTKVGDFSGTTATVTGLSCSTSSTFTVDAIDAAGNRSATVSVQASTAACPANVFVANDGSDFKWMHLAATYDGSMLRIYENGVQVAATAVSGDLVASNGRIRIGGEPLANISANVWFDGLIDDLRIYDRALGAGQIQTDMAASVATSSPAPGLVAAYAFDAGSGTTAADSSGNSNDGTIANAQWVAGKHGGALLFDGRDSVVTVNDSASLDFSAGMTLEAWVQPRTLNGWNTVIAKETTSDVAWGLYANNPDSAPEAELYTGAGYAAAAATAPLPGNDCSAADPCRTLDRAYHLAQPGQTVQLAAGTYPEQSLTADSSKTSTDDVVIQPAAGANVSLAGLSIAGSHLTLKDLAVRGLTAVGYGSSPTDVTLQNIDGENFNVFGGASFITFKGGDWGPSTCTSSNNGGGCEAMIAASNVNGVTTLPHDIVFDGIYMHDYQSTSPAFHDTCIFLVSGYNITIENSKFRDCADQDLFIQDWPANGLHDVTIQNNWFAAPCANPNPLLDTNPVNCVEQNNLTISFSGRNSIVWTNFLLRNNTILGSIDLGNGDTAGWSNVRVVGNLGEFPAAEYFKTLPDPVFPSCQGVAPGLTWSHNVWLSGPCGSTDLKVTDLGLVDAANFDYHLLPTSPGINAGDPNDFPAADIFGQSRPLGSAPDAGAVESG